jgi:hypothetical protein
MRLFNTQASKSSKLRARGIGGGLSRLMGPASSRASSARDTCFEPMESRQMFSVATTTVIHDPIPKLPFPTVSITARYGNELVVTADGSKDSVTVDEGFVYTPGETTESVSGSKGSVSVHTNLSPILTIDADGNTYTEAIPAGGLFVYTRGGDDTVTIDSAVSVFTTVDTIDNAPSTVHASGSNTIVWADSTDTVTGTASVHRVASFAGGVSKALGASLANPKDSGTTTTVNLPLFGTGPVASDINQGGVGDCYFLASLAAFAHTDPGVILNSAVDLGDDTFAVEFYKHGTPEYIRVNNSFPAGGSEGLAYAHPGPDNTIWAMVMEKAFCYFRTGANTYASIGYGWPSEVYSDLNVSCVANNPKTFSNSTLFSRLSSDLSHDEPVTLCTPVSAPQLRGDHCYTLMSVEVVGGVDEYTVRNPWGFSGDSLEDAQGIATLTYSELVNNFDVVTEAT